MEKYKFRPYNKDYPKLYERELRKLRNILPKNFLIEHVGSTAVLGLRGKGLIDILIAVPKSKINSTKRLLEKSNYEFRPNAGDKHRLFFRRDYISNNKTRRVHVHLTRYLSKPWCEMIAVRDYLRLNKKEAFRYEVVKRKAVKVAKGEGEIYRKYKSKYLASLSKKALKHGLNNLYVH